MSENSTLNKLSQKVAEMLSSFEALRQENALLKDEVAQLRSEGSNSSTLVTQLRDELNEKDREIEEIVTKIESMLG